MRAFQSVYVYIARGSSSISNKWHTKARIRQSDGACATVLLATRFHFTALVVLRSANRATGNSKCPLADACNSARMGPWPLTFTGDA